jgi:hypothetical protein
MGVPGRNQELPLPGRHCSMPSSMMPWRPVMDSMAIRSGAITACFFMRNVAGLAAALEMRPHPLDHRLDGGILTP